MKTTKTILLGVAITVLALSVSCKGESKNETIAVPEEAVQEATTSAIIYTVDVANSTIAWVGTKPAGKHTGTIALAKGAVTATDGSLDSGAFEIDMTTINVTDLEGDEKAGLEGHLKGEGENKEDHFFNVAKFPTAKFEITEVTKVSDTTMIKGNLTLKGITKNISFPAVTTVTDTVFSIQSEPFTINRTEWGVNYGSKSVFENLGNKFINDDIQLTVTVKANKS